jgi:RNase adaptor protein for sRNA GlmZ degradation
LPVIKIVGVSAAGKSTLVRALRERGYDARAVSQEHSHMGDLWKLNEIPRVLIYLDNDLEGQRRRRPDVSWDESHLAEERDRLQEAYAAADLRLNTATLAAADVLAMALAFLRAQDIRHAPEPLPPAPATGASRA